MNVYVCIKQVPDTEASLNIKEGKRINEENIKWVINPYDEYAIEEALKLKEKKPEIKVVLVTLGPVRVESALRSGLAMGADEAIHIELADSLEPQITARALAKAIEQEGDIGLVFTGKQAIDDDAYQTHLFIAEYLGLPAATNVTAFSFQGDKVIVEREIDEGSKEKIEMALPCLVGASKGLNTPRYASLMGIMKAKKIAIKKLTLEGLGMKDIRHKVVAEKLVSPPEKPQGKIIQGEPEEAVKELVRLLREEAKVL